MGEWMDNWLRYIAGQGYGWYLALKIGKAACLPLWVVGWLVYALLGGAFVFLGGCFVAAKETAGVIVRDFAANVLRPRWFSGFSRVYYNGLHRYNPPEDTTP